METLSSLKNAINNFIRKSLFKIQECAMKIVKICKKIIRASVAILYVASRYTNYYVREEYLDMVKFTINEAKDILYKDVIKNLMRKNNNYIIMAPNKHSEDVKNVANELEMNYVKANTPKELVAVYLTAENTLIQVTDQSQVPDLVRSYVVTYENKIKLAEIIREKEESILSKALSIVLDRIQEYFILNSIS